MFDSIFAHEPFVVFNVCFQWSKIKKTTDSLKNKIILYKSKKPESINKKILTNDQKRFIYSQFRLLH